MAAAKRFYKEVAAVAGEGGFAVALDGRSLRTPSGSALIVPTHPLAEAIAGEWDSQVDIIDPGSMPLMRLVSTAIDRVSPKREPIVDQVLSFGTTDLLCYRAEQPVDLVARQQAVWQVLLDWAGRTYGGHLEVTTGIVPIAQPEAALSALRRPVETTSDLELTALASATAAAGSLVIGLALLAGELDAEAAFEAAELDATFQIERWGEDAEAAQRRARLRGDFQSVKRFLDLGRR